jgi:hypothetical protein
LIQLKQIVLYSRWGDNRTIDLKPGHLNIITGKQRTGKSAIGKIIEYVLGSDGFGVPVGAIRDTVAWYGLVIVAGDTELFVARPDPGENQSTSNMYLQVDVSEGLPSTDALQVNTNTDAVRERLGRLSGIVANLHEPSEGQTRRPLEAKLSHALLYCFQGQNVVANPDILFHKQNEEYVAQAIRDTFPYFLGAIADDRLDKASQLRLLRQQIRILDNELAELESLRNSTSSRMQSLLDEAVSVGLIKEWTTETAFDILNALSQVESPSVDLTNEDPGSELRSERSQLVEKFGGLRDAIRAANRYRNEQGGFGSEARHQLLRLKSVDLFGQSDALNCPVCEQVLPDTITRATDLLDSIKRLDEQISIAQLEEPRLVEYLGRLSSESVSVEREIEALDLRIEALASQSQAMREQQRRDIARGRVIGRISLFLESLNEVKHLDGKSRLDRLTQLKLDVAGLSAELDEESLRDRISTLMGSFSRQISDMADRFELEHKGFGISLDLRKLTLVVEQGTRSVPLSQIGSGENWVGYHLAFFLALHSWFRTMERPVPAFLFIDQPTQAYFPPDSDSDGGLGDLKDDDDRKAVRRMFENMLQVIQHLAPEMQIIVTDHADIGEDWFRDCVIERWRNGKALIPSEWIEKNI